MQQKYTLTFAKLTNKLQVQEQQTIIRHLEQVKCGFQAKIKGKKKKGKGDTTKSNGKISKDKGEAPKRKNSYLIVFLKRLIMLKGIVSLRR